MHVQVHNVQARMCRHTKCKHACAGAQSASTYVQAHIPTLTHMFHVHYDRSTAQVSAQQAGAALAAQEAEGAHAPGLTAWRNVLAITDIRSRRSMHFRHVLSYPCFMHAKYLCACAYVHAHVACAVYRATRRQLSVLFACKQPFSQTNPLPGCALGRPCMPLIALCVHVHGLLLHNHSAKPTRVCRA